MMGKLPLFHLKDDLIVLLRCIRRSDIDIAALITAENVRERLIFRGCFENAFQDLLLVHQ